MSGVISILCASKNSVYKTFENVEDDADRDVRNFHGGSAIVAHPPCRAWSCRLRHQAKPPKGEREIAPLCVEWLKNCGGVLEHPAHSLLWKALNLPLPNQTSPDGLRSIEVLQAWFGFPTMKRTWLLFHGIDPNQLPLPYRLHDPRGDNRRFAKMSRHQRSATTEPFARWLVDAARLARTRPD